jgi:predicted dehydrogenase
VDRAEPVAAPYDDPLHFMAAVIRGQVSEEGTLSSLKTNLIVSEILDAARRSAQTGQTVKLPLTD